MTEKEMLDLLENEYLPKILGFCYKKVDTREDAEDLTQEISIEILKAIHSGKIIENLNAFIWSVSNHMFFNWLRKKKRGNTAYMTELFESEVNIETEYIKREQENLMRREIALLSANYRKAVVLYYFNNINCNDIAQILGKNVGTVKWWLHDARKSIKEGMNQMREYGEKSYNPGTLAMSCQGQPGANYEPMNCAKLKSTQNILLAAYQKPLTIEELCIELGFPAPYMEDEISSLLENQLMKEVSSGKYQTDFVILSGSNVFIADKIYDDCFPYYYKKLMNLLDNNKSMLMSDKFNIAGFTWDRLLWVYIQMITDINLCKFKREECKKVMYDNIPQRPNGGQWIALGFDNSIIFNGSSEFKEYCPWDGPVHKSMNDFAQGFFHYWSGLDSSVFFDIPDGVFELGRGIIKDEIDINNFTDEQKYIFSTALEKKLFINTSDGFKLNYYFVPRYEYKEIENLAYSFYDEAKVEFAKAYNLVLDEYLPKIPKHLHWQMGNFLSNNLNCFVTCSLYDAVNDDKLSIPDSNNKEWLSLFASEI